MENRLTKLGEYLRQFMDWLHISEITIIDIIEMIILAFLIYNIMLWIKNTKAWMLVKGIIVTVIFILLAALMNMQTILWLSKSLLSVLMISLVVIFQPELRNALEKLGQKNILKTLLPVNLDNTIVDGYRFNDATKSSIIDAAIEMAKYKTGALIVIEKKIVLDEYINTGIDLDSKVSKQLLINIFEHNTPLHDGAVIIRGDRIKAATCILPLSNNLNISKDFGTRHRAALGLSEKLDALIIVVSEETGEISVASEAKLNRNVTKSSLKKYLESVQVIEKDVIVSTGRGANEEKNN